MDRREFLVRLGRVGIAAGFLATIDEAGRFDRSRRVGGRIGPSAEAGPVVSASALPSGTSPQAPLPARARDNAIVAENRRPGDGGWDPWGRNRTSVTSVTSASAFSAPVSVAPAERLDLHVASPTPVDVDWFRLGWYDGRGGRLVRQDRGVPARQPRPAIVDTVTGRVESSAPAALSVLPDEDWPSGVYLAVVRPRIGPAAVAPFIVRSAPSAPAPVLFVAATATWQAYNPWGGADLYSASPAVAPRQTGGVRAVEVSADRPYRQQSGAGVLPRWELPFLRWRERVGRDVAYAADIDLELHPEVVDGRRLILFVGHHEYWSRPMRGTIEGAIAAGTNVAFLSADNMAWQVRLEPSRLGPGRRMTCFKSARLDPVAATDPSLTTCRWREPPVDDPEALVIGQMYGHIVEHVADWVVAGSGHWLYDGTGLRDGDSIRNLVGQEFDEFFPSLAHPGTTILARSPVRAAIRRAPLPGPSPVSAEAAMQTATAYVADSGATVLSAGTFQWSWALDDYGAPTYRGVGTPLDPRLERMTTNVLDRLGDGPLQA